jgi:hypothetical protein
LFGQVAAQNNLLSTKSVHYTIKSLVYSYDSPVPTKGYLDFTKDLKLISVNTANPYFQRSYMINKEGETISSGFMPSSYFLPNDNFIVLSGKNTTNRDSFNPYGSPDLPSAIFFGTLNSFISRWKKSKR